MSKVVTIESLKNKEVVTLDQYNEDVKQYEDLLMEMLEKYKNLKSKDKVSQYHIQECHAKILELKSNITDLQHKIREINSSITVRKTGGNTKNLRDEIAKLLIEEEKISDEELRVAAKKMYGDI